MGEVGGEVGVDRGVGWGRSGPGSLGACGAAEGEAGDGFFGRFCCGADGSGEKGGETEVCCRRREKICYFEKRGRDDFKWSVLHPTLGPATAMSGTPPKNFGESVSMP